MFGDDVRAAVENPGGTGAGVPAPFATHPDAAANPTLVPAGRVRHAPYAFRTLTGAILYTDALELRFGQWTTFAIVHCLPGLYGPTAMLGVELPIDPTSGMRFNGETWPVTIPRYVSIQGTSTLDTIFDARLAATAILIPRFTGPGPIFGITHQDCFVDSVTIRRARANGQPMARGNAARAGIYFPVGQSFLTVSNCFLIDNDVGVGVDTLFEQQFPNRPNLVNCTFARNRIGVWNGSRDPMFANVGWTVLTVLNCIFDDWSPVLPLTDTTPFVGMNANYLTVRSFTFSGGSPSFPDPGRAYSAWAAGRANFPPASLPAGWPVPAVRLPFPPQFPAPRVDLGPYTNEPGTGLRGILYLNDVFRASGIGAAYSPHDFRLSPFAQIGVGAPSLPNPLVNQGICIAPGGISVIEMRSLALFGGVLIATPFGPVGINGEPSATLHCWDLDCEGFGNPRIVNRSGFTVGPLNDGNTPIDLGADECDELIMGGFIDGTRILSAPPPTAPLVVDHKRVYFFNLPSLQNVSRPHHNALPGQTFEWWPHVQGAPDAAPGTNYTRGVVGTLREFAVFGGVKPSFMRALGCDFSPSLLSDPHAQWAGAFSSPSSTDIYASNPWWWSPAGSTIPWDNAAVYDNSGVGLHGDQNITVLAFQLTQTPILSGTINPPGTLESATRYLHPTYPIAVFGAFLPCLDGTTYSTNVFGMGSAGPNCPDWAPLASFPWQGVRYNCQVRDFQQGDTLPFRYNLQTFLGVTDVAPVPVLEEALLVEPSAERRRTHGRRVLDELTRRGGR